MEFLWFAKIPLPRALANEIVLLLRLDAYEVVAYVFASCHEELLTIAFVLMEAVES